MYVYDTSANFKVETNCVETESFRCMLFERSDLTVLLNGSPISPGKHKGRLEIVGGDSNVCIPSAIVELKARTLIAEEVLDC
jgi:hypothetical protein